MGAGSLKFGGDLLNLRGQKVGHEAAVKDIALIQCSEERTFLWLQLWSNGRNDLKRGKPLCLEFQWKVGGLSSWSERFAVGNGWEVLRRLGVG